ALGTSSADPATLLGPGGLGRLYDHLPFKIAGMRADNALGEPSGGYLEVRYDYALNLLEEAVQLNWAMGTPLPVEYQLLNGMFWEYAGSIGGGQTGFLLGEEIDGDAPQETESDLLFNPLFDSWYLDSLAIEAVAQEVAGLGSSPPHE